jgi:hypothetical protein
MNKLTALLAVHRLLLSSTHLLQADVPATVSLSFIFGWWNVFVVLKRVVFLSHAVFVRSGQAILVFGVLILFWPLEAAVKTD